MAVRSLHQQAVLLIFSETPSSCGGAGHALCFVSGGVSIEVKESRIVGRLDV